MSIHTFLEGYCNSEGWTVVSVQKREASERKTFPLQSLGLSQWAMTAAERLYPDGLYRHQLEAVSKYASGSDVAIATGTASGKSAVFHLSALEMLSRDADSRILAIYPLKALGKEQEIRWKGAFRAAGLPEGWVARADGDVPVKARIRRLKDARCLIATPDIVHAWLLPNVGEPNVWGFIRRIRTIVVDEVHTYSGVFGSNAAFLFRRLETVMGTARTRASYIAASATIRDSAKHLRDLTGREFEIIDETLDSSGRYPLTVYMVDPPAGKDLMGPLSRLVQAIVARTDSRFIVFLDSRKQVESLASITARNQRLVTSSDDSDDDDSDEVKEDEERGGSVRVLEDHLSCLDVLPYRAGFEEDDRAHIQGRLSDGKLRGVVSTSALELGIDIGDLETCILVGVPRSTTSLQQRIGRVGRQGEGVAIIVNDGDLNSEVVFRNPSSLFQRPLADSTMYLENRRIQYIHAMCLARMGGEYEQASGKASSSCEPDQAVELSDLWPSGFAGLCRAERTGQVPQDLQAMKMEAGETPHYVYPLRDVGVQFTVELRQGPIQHALGSLTHSQVMREAYPGAIYYYATRPYRVYKVLPRSKKVLVRGARYYTTSPNQGPTMVYPNLADEGLIQACSCGDLIMLESDAQIHEAVYGYEERRGSSRIRVDYPCDSSTAPLSYSQQSFSRYFFTTTVMMTHPSLDRQGVECHKLAELIYECFLVEVPLERQDIQYASGRLKVSAGRLVEGTRFLAVYDQTYGSLRLSGRLLEAGVAARVFNRAVQVASSNSLFDLNEETLTSLKELAACFNEKSVNMLAEICGGHAAAAASREPEGQIRVIMPGSEGLNIMGSNCKFKVDSVFFSPREGGLAYRGHNDYEHDSPVPTIVPASSIMPIPGESRMGLYDLDTGELVAGELSIPMNSST